MMNAVSAKVMKNTTQGPRANRASVSWELTSMLDDDLALWPRGWRVPAPSQRGPGPGGVPSILAKPTKGRGATQYGGLRRTRRLRDHAPVFRS